MILESSRKMTPKEETAFELGYKKAKSEIVHCRDCKKYVQSYGGTDNLNGLVGANLKPYDFCSYGVRTDGETA